MKFIERHLFLHCSLAFCIIQALLYIPQHLAYTGAVADLSDGVAVALGAITSALTNFASFALPVFAAAVLFISYAYRGLAHALPRVLFFSVPYIVGTVPQYYINFLSYFDSYGAIFFSLVYSALIVLMITAQMLALFGVICFFFRLNGEARFDRATLAPLEAKDALDISDPFAKGLFAAVLLQFTITVIPEIKDTVSFIIEGKGTYGAMEILTVMMTFLFILSEMLITYILTFKLKDKLIRERLIEDDDAEA